ncbi:hypothetical protein HZS_4938 [Henneguya salminicola]|nr:hypothetical protein HZS_4938 [Henneguya salminicola]
MFLPFVAIYTSITTSFDKKYKFFASSIFPSGKCTTLLRAFENYLIETGKMDQKMEIFKYFEDNFIG